MDERLNAALPPVLAADASSSAATVILPSFFGCGDAIGELSELGSDLPLLLEPG